MSVINSYEQFYAPDRKTWRKWLDKNHSILGGIWLVYYKKETGKPRIAYAEAVEEALCFGWIDSTMRPLDEERYMQLFTPRKASSEWSALNKQRVEKLIEQGLMTVAGLEKIKVSKANGNWEKIDHVEALQLPEDFAKKLKRSKIATAYFESLTKTNKKYLLHWLGNAKREDTRSKRIEEIIVALKKRQMPDRFR
ncbi:MAG TPA: YdeI/OmpD-associated family protein [Flavipsychrobacter sp.]|nr:YdeI/OmpD-associated family protein [Flavipsychrobacter sp.]